MKGRIHRSISISYLPLSAVKKKYSPHPSPVYANT